METSQSGLLERLRAQRESMQAAAAPTAPPPIDDGPLMDDGPVSAAVPMAPVATAAAPDVSPMVREHAGRLSRLEADGEAVRSRLDSIESNLRAGLAELRTELPGTIAAEVARQTTTTNDALADVGSRVGRLENDFTRERERWNTVVTSFDQRLDHRLRSFRQDVTVMLAGMAVLVLAMLMLLLMRR